MKTEYGIFYTEVVPFNSKPLSLSNILVLKPDALALGYSARLKNLDYA